MRQVSVLFARFPYGRTEDPDVTDWLVKTVIQAKADPRISEVLHWRIDDTPITMGRNRCLEIAKKKKADYVLMVDSDMSPDLPDVGAKPFWPSSFDFAFNHAGPCVVAAPYCGPPPHSNVYVFQWGNKTNDAPDHDMELEQFTREEAAQRGGFEEVAALPTGLFLLDMRALACLKPPYFYYEFTDKTESEKASTEDVTFTRDLSMAGVPIYTNWDAWSGHWKRWRADKPRPLTLPALREKFTEAAWRNQKNGEKLIMVGEGQHDCLAGSDQQNLHQVR